MAGDLMPRPPPGIQVVVFDLGGVLVQLGGVQEMADLCGGITIDELWRRWLACRWVRSFERGRCTTTQFARGVVDDWDLPVDDATFLAAFRSWPIGPEPGAADLVAAVREQLPTACLSNTNALHWEVQIERGFGLERMFDHRFLSHELGRIKPDPDVFAHVADALGYPAPAVLFLDDNRINVDAARAAGWQAERTQGVAQARAALERHGVLPAA